MGGLFWELDFSFNLGGGHIKGFLCVTKGVVTSGVAGLPWTPLFGHFSPGINLREEFFSGVLGSK